MVQKQTLHPMQAKSRMNAVQHISRQRRVYNQWVANETLEDYALRFTAKSARRWSGARVANTALGAISFLALEAIGGVITIHYGFDNAVAAILAVGLVIFLTAIPISYYATRYGIDIDLLTRSAGFGYIGSTVTSLIYASFTFIFFAIESAIMAMAIEMLTGIPFAVSYVVSSLLIIPLVTHGITLIGRFQLWTQPFWMALQILPFALIIYQDASKVTDWQQFSGLQSGGIEGFNLALFGAASGVIFSLMAQIGEQVDFIRFIPPQEKGKRLRWWSAMLAGGPGWIIIGGLKMLAGSFLAVLAFGVGLSSSESANPIHMYMVAFNFIMNSPATSLAVAGIFVILCQVKINVTNAYAGSIAWSNFFSRLTHSHPGRVVWLIFNVAIAILLMELGVYEALEATLAHYAIVAVAWVGALAADLVINKPLGLSPPQIEFKRAHLYDINPVGVGSLILASMMGFASLAGVFGETAESLAHFITLGAALITAPLIAWFTGGRYYIARPAVEIPSSMPIVTCCLCEHRFDREDMTQCPAYGGYICSLCCSLDSRCGDRCKPDATYKAQITHFLSGFLPERLLNIVTSRVGHFLLILAVINGFLGLIFAFVYSKTPVPDDATSLLLHTAFVKVFVIISIITGVISWLFVLAHESRSVAQEESARQTRLLLEEIAAHERTDLALQEAKEQAEAANGAKSRYLTGISHELRSPLNAVLGYAQLLEKDSSLSRRQADAIATIRRSGEYLADLIEGLLDISKIEAGRLELNRSEFRIDAMMSQLVHMFRIQAEDKGLQFSYHCQGRLPEFVAGDEKRLRQILINLLSNAIKYTDHGSVTLTLRYRSQVAEFTVTDTGEGIAPEHMDRIFMPFERVRTPGSTRTGTGLGLTITRLLCDIMGGDISVESTPGVGSTFRVSLMLSSVHQPATPLLPVETEQAQHCDARGMRIVQIDDEAQHRNLMRAFLEPLGVELIDVDNALTAVDTVTREQPDLVMLDVSMPGMGGWEVLRQLREAQQMMPALMISADASEGRQETTSRVLHNGYIIKPVRLPELMDTLGKLMKLEGLPGELPPTARKRIGTLELPAPEVTRPLLELATIGHRRGLLDEIHRLGHQGKVSEAFSAHVTRLINEFQFDRLTTFLRGNTHA